jgi:hypothetical protein
MASKDPKREREHKHVNLDDDTIANVGIADIHHLGKGLIPLYTVLNQQAVNRAYHYSEFPKSDAITLSKKQITNKEAKTKKHTEGLTNFARTMEFDKIDDDQISK